MRLAADEAAAIYREKTRARARARIYILLSPCVQQPAAAAACDIVPSFPHGNDGRVPCRHCNDGPDHEQLLLRAVIIFHIILYVVYTVLPTVSYNHGYNITGQWEKFGHLPPAHHATAAADLRPPCRAHSSALLNGLFGKPSPIPIRLPRRTQLSTFRRAPTAAVRRSLTVVCVRVLCRVRGARLCNM